MGGMLQGTKRRTRRRPHGIRSAQVRAWGVSMLSVDPISQAHRWCCRGFFRLWLIVGTARRCPREPRGLLFPLCFWFTFDGLQGRSRDPSFDYDDGHAVNRGAGSLGIRHLTNALRRRSPQVSLCFRRYFVIRLRSSRRETRISRRESPPPPPYSPTEGPKATPIHAVKPVMKRSPSFPPYGRRPGVISTKPGAD